MDQKYIYNIIKNNNLEVKCRTYVQLFTDGSYMFWNKIPSFTQYINDVNHKLYDFYLSVRNKSFNQNSIYCQHEKFTTDINEIINSDFYKRLDQTYLFDRNYKDIIKATDDQQTFFYVQIDLLTEEIYNAIKHVKGKYLIICNYVFDFDNIKTESKIFNENSNLYFIYNYQKEKQQDLFV